MFEAELKFSGRVFEASWIENDKQVNGSLRIVHSKSLRIITLARLSAFPERVHIYSVYTVMKWVVTGAVIGIEYLSSSLQLGCRL